MNYKNTLLIFNTLFKLHIDLPKKEQQIQFQWKKNKLVDKINEKNKNNLEFIIHDGPPYANGNLHLGHAFNKILKDIIVRFYNQKGYYSPLICGWDAHGLPIENIIFTKGINRQNFSILQFRNICKKYALQQIKIQSRQFCRLGLLTDLKKKYITLDFKYELMQLSLFKKMVDNELVYRSLKPTYWSFFNETTLADSEVEYSEVLTPAIYVTFLLINTNNIFPKNTKIIIWTTTPWTIPMNELLAVGENIIYCIIMVKNNYYIFAKDLLNNVKYIFQESYKIVKEIFGKELLDCKAFHPLYNNKISKIVIGYNVVVTMGSGVIHIAPGFGENDYNIAYTNNIKILMPINDKGIFTEIINDKELIGVFYEDANKIIIKRLKTNGNLLKFQLIKHKNLVDIRNKKPVIWRVTWQWFVSINKIKTKLISAINKVIWKPFWTQKMIQNMINNREDWCISRQRWWGVPIIAFYDENNNPRISSELIEYVINLFKLKKTINIWFKWSVDKLLPDKYKNKGWKKETNIMDVWFDSGISNLFISKLYNLNHPFEIFLEGIDQFRGWFNSSLICSIVAKNKAPYKTVLAHGFVNDKHGKKMSKSLGNVINPEEIINKYGVDVLRMWVISVNFHDDVKISIDIIKQILNIYYKIRNTFKFLLNNLFDFNPEIHLVSNLTEVNLYILFLIKKFKIKVTKYYELFNFNNIFNLINNFINTILSNFYLNFIKDIIYIENINSINRRNIQTVLYYIYRVLIDILKPILPHTTEEIYKFIKYNNKKSSVHLENDFHFDINISEKLIAKWSKFMKFRDDVNKEIEIQRQKCKIKKSLTCTLIVYFKNFYKELVNIENLHQILIVSEIIFSQNIKELNEYETSFLKIQEKKGIKCQRCWLIFDKLFQNNEICQRCFIIINNK